ncbi:DUF6531 domain-containing protein [Luteibacter sp. CQ10]|uniref:DUF6531 domain-containing protein n=1 Tax=Luteibacter sp. CQ10 TaxID=2805821 RepID=UPI0034A453A2
MRVLLLLAGLVFSTGVTAGQYYYTLDEDGSGPTSVHYATPDEACHVAYGNEMAGPPPGDNYAIGPYQAPFVIYSLPPKIEFWECDVRWVDSEEGDSLVSGHGIDRHGDNCTEHQVYNPMSGLCESPDTEQGRKELGDPTSPSNVGFVSCGDPINPANGNVFESETDYADSDGELRFSRSYNSGSGSGWSSTFSIRIYPDTDGESRGAVVRFEDGRTSLFVAKDGGLVPDGGELGSLTQTSSGWTYNSQFNEQMTFDSQGRLTRWQRADGRATTVSYTSPSTSDVVMLVTDSLGHQMTYTTHYGWPLSLVVGNLTINYTVDSSFRVTGVKKSWPGHSTTRTYLYEDTAHPKLLTGVVDERGVRVSTWTYDASGRATSATMANGMGKFSFVYNSDGSTTVTNPLGHPVVYRFSIVQGAKRITAIEGEPVAGCPASNSTFTYTENGQLDSRTDAVGSKTTFAYDPLGREISRTEAKGTGAERTTTTTWDGSSFRPKTVTATDHVKTYNYDEKGRAVSVVTSASH